MEYNNENKGALFKNDKGDNPNRPDYRGPLNVDGVDKEMAAWLKTSKDGKSYMQITVSAPREKAEPKTAQPEDTDEQINLDDIPF